VNYTLKVVCSFENKMRLKVSNQWNQIKSTETLPSFESKDAKWLEWLICLGRVEEMAKTSNCIATTLRIHPYDI